MNQRPPFLLHLVAAAFLVAASIQAFGTIELVRSWNWLQMTGYSPSPLVVVFKNAFLTLAFLLSAIFLWTRLPLAPGFSAAALLLGTAWFWVNRIVLTSNPLPFKNHLFLILADLVLVLLAIASLYLLVPYMKTHPEDKEVENE
jgi:hypothetical protein